MTEHSQLSATEELLLAEPHLEDELRRLQKVEALATEKVLREASLGTMLQRTADFFGQHPTILLTLLYVQICLFGISYLWSFYMQFGIGIFEFVRVTDLLLAAFREPAPLIASLIVLIAEGVVVARIMHVLRGRLYLLKDRVSLLDVAVIQPAKAKDDYSDHTRLITEAFEQQKTELEETIHKMEESLRRRVILVAVMVVVFTFVAPCIAGWSHARKVQCGHGQQVVVQLKTDSREATETESQQELTWLGATEQFAFLYDRANHYAYVIPIANILQIQNTTVELSGKSTSTATASPTQTMTPKSNAQ